jgi:hypothetical protein
VFPKRESFESSTLAAFALFGFFAISTVLKFLHPPLFPPLLLGLHGNLLFPLLLVVDNR